MGKSVTITEGGRTGAVIYHEGAGRLSFWWEFGGGDVVAIVNVGDEEEWRAKYPWAAGRRAEILGFVAAEVIRQKAPTCRAEIQRANGFLLVIGLSDDKDRQVAGGFKRTEIRAQLQAIEFLV